MPYPAITIATPADRALVIELQRRESNAVGHLTTAAIDWYLSTGNALVARLDREPVAYLLGRPKMRQNPDIKPITQIVVTPRARRMGVATALVDAAAAIATADGRKILQAWTRSDLTANAFWQHGHFTAVAIRRPWTKRGHPLILWRRALTRVPTRELHALPRQAGWKAAKSTAVRIRRET